MRKKWTTKSDVKKLIKKVKIIKKKLREYKFQGLKA